MLYSYILPHTLETDNLHKKENMIQGLDPGDRLPN